MKINLTKHQIKQLKPIFDKRGLEDPDVVPNMILASIRYDNNKELQITKSWLDVGLVKQPEAREIQKLALAGHIFHS